MDISQMTDAVYTAKGASLLAVPILSHLPKNYKFITNTLPTENLSVLIKNPLDIHLHDMFSFCQEIVYKNVHIWV